MNLLVKQNPGVFSPEIEDRIPTSIDMMEKQQLSAAGHRATLPGRICAVSQHHWHQVLVAARRLRRRSRVGQECTTSVCLHGETRVHTTHEGLHENDESIQEVMCILQRHILEANDEPCTDESEIVMPESMSLTSIRVPRWPCPTSAWKCPASNGSLRR